MLGVAVLAGCGVPGVPKPPSLDLPQPASDLRAVRKGNRVFLAWTVPSETTDRLPARHLGSTRIWRSLTAAMTECTSLVGELAAAESPRAGAQRGKPEKRTANYTDNLPPALLVQDTGAQVFYAISVMNGNGRSAGLSNVVPAPALAALLPPSDFRAQVTAEGVVLSWAKVPEGAATPGLRRLYRGYRRLEGGEADTVVGEVPLDADSATQMVDHTFDWEKTYFYRATIVTVIEQEGKPEIQFEGEDTSAIKVFAHDVFPPAVPSGLQAVFSGTGQQAFIDLIWAPDTDADLAGYNVFRHEAGGEPVRINAETVKAPAFRDPRVVSGHNYFYSVSAVDVRGNASARSEEASEAVP